VHSRNVLFTEMHSGRMRDNGRKLKQNWYKDGKVHCKSTSVLDNPREVAECPFGSLTDQSLELSGRLDWANSQALSFCDLVYTVV